MNLREYFLKIFGTEPQARDIFGTMVWDRAILQDFWRNGH